MRRLNEHVLGRAVEESFAEPSVLVADTTAQEAAIPYPNEVGLMTSFIAAASAVCKGGERMLRDFFDSMQDEMTSFAKKARDYRLFAKTKAVKDESAFTAPSCTPSFAARSGRRWSLD